MNLRIERRLSQPRWLSFVVPVCSLLLAFVISGIVLLLTGHNPLSIFRQLFEAGFTNPGALDQTLITMTPIAFTGLCAAAAFRMKLYNIGGEGQLYLGAITGAAAGIYFGGRGGTSVFVVGAMIAAGAAGGAAWALIAGVLKAFFRTSEIITSLMLNYVAGWIVIYLIQDSESYWRQTKGQNATVFPTGKTIPHSGIWPSWTIDVQGGITIPFGLVLAAVVAVGLWFLYSRTRFGLEVSVLSDSERAARYGGVRVRRKILAVMAISGAVAGLGGASQVGDFAPHQLDGDPNGTLLKLGYGYTGIVVAALARYNPIAVLPVAFLLGGLEQAGSTLAGPGFSTGLVGVMQGIILFCTLGGELLIRYRIRFAASARAAETPEVAA
jgi:general nucleoside transport system permease protein